jgi:scaffold protein (connect acetoacetyl-CoA thiolase and HMG-CoA synthase)
MAIPRFWREIGSRYNLIGSKCGSCGKVDFPPRAVCPDCGRRSVGKMQRHQLNGKGTVVTYTIIHDAPKQFDLQKPYVMAIIETEEGVRLTSQLIDISHDDVKIGMKVQATFRKLGAEGEAGVIHYGYKFRPARANGPPPV